jgi:alpha-tubulin suppressor-like RCC1 family protein
MSDALCGVGAWAWIAASLALAGCSGDDTVGLVPDAAASSIVDATAPSDGSRDAAVDAGLDASALDGSGDASSTDAARDASVPLQGVVGLAGTATSVAGSTSFCALLSDGSVRCWGNDGYGQSGTGAPASPYVTPLPVEPLGLAFGVSIVAVGDTFAGAVQEGSTLLWGDDSVGELGNDAVAPSYTPRLVTGLGGATALSLGGEAGCVVIAGAVSCWGSNAFGNVGTGTTAVQRAPVAIGVDASKVAVSQHACALAPGGSVVCWGRDDFGQLGRTTTSTCTTASVPCAPDPAPSSLTAGATGLSVGLDFTCAIAPRPGDAGSAVAAQCWGDNRDGQLGGPADALQHVAPVVVTGLAGVPSQLAAGGAFACALVAGGAVQCWGADDRGQLGTPTAAAPPVIVVTGATAVAAGAATACAVLEAGTVECWGANDQGQLGIGSVDQDVHPPTLVLAR